MDNLRQVHMLLIKNGQNLDVVRRWMDNSGVAEEIIGFYIQKAVTDLGMPDNQSIDMIYLSSNST